MLLNGKNAIIYGAAGHVGQAVSRTFGREGARLFLAGRTAEALDAVAGEVESGAHTAQVDAGDPIAVERHFSSVVDLAGGVDISVNVIGVEDVQGRELVDMSLDDDLRPVELGARTHFVTATAAARHMSERRRGVIMTLTATPARLALPLVGGFGAACAAIEAMMRTLASEVGSKGVRVCWLRSAGSPESFGPDVTRDADGQPTGLTDGDYLERLRRATLLERFPRLAEVAEAAAFIGSDRASATTGAAFNLTCGQIVD